MRESAMAVGKHFRRLGSGLCKPTSLFAVSWAPCGLNSVGHRQKAWQRRYMSSRLTSQCARSCTSRLALVRPLRVGFPQRRALHAAVCSKIDSRTSRCVTRVPRARSVPPQAALESKSCGGHRGRCRARVGIVRQDFARKTIKHPLCVTSC